ncbi:MAG: glycosyltransferase family 9 protein [Alphaproteobacteria bacterium]|nr:glycosyltransferase family 9 protein [Alphaproteobacteria bacterium]
MPYYFWWAVYNQYSSPCLVSILLFSFYLKACIFLNMQEKILFITSSRIGDAVLSNGILNHLVAKFPQARVTVACGPLVESLYAGLPQLERVIPLRKQSWKRHWIKLWREVIGTHWDVVVDLRNSAISRLVYARHKYVMGMGIDQSHHKAIQNASILGLETLPETRLWLSVPQIEKARELIPDGSSVLGIGPTANWIGKTWPIENFINLVGQLISDQNLFSGWRVAVFAAPGEEDAARKLLASLPDGIGIDLIAKGNVGEAAACLSRCDFYIGNDSGLMHAAAAAGVPTLGLFGASYPEIYAPFGKYAAYVRTPETFDELTGYDGYNSRTLKQSLMGSLTVDAVMEAVLALKNSVGFVVKKRDILHCVQDDKK